MTTIYTRLIAAALFVTLAAPATADPITIATGQTVTLTFGTNPGNWDFADPPDYLDFSLNVFPSDWLSENKTVNVALYDGDRLLGSRTGAGVGAIFQGAGMEVRRDWVDRPLDVIDFSSLLDGTINGRLELSPVAGAFRFDPATLDLRSWSPDYFGPHPLMLMDSTPLAGFWVARGDFDWIRDPRIDITNGHAITPVPEPGTLSLMATGLVIGVARLRKRRKEMR